MKKKSPKKTLLAVKNVPVKKKTAGKTKSPKKMAVKKSLKKVSPVKKKTKRKPETLMCFLTTACVHYYNLPDNGYELTTLRRYRDTYLAASDEGKNLIKEYYKISPGIVSQVEKDQNKKSVYAYIYSEVKLSCAAIEKNKLAYAKRIYTRMVKSLQEKYFKP